MLEKWVEFGIISEVCSMRVTLRKNETDVQITLHLPEKRSFTSLDEAINKINDWILGLQNLRLELIKLKERLNKSAGDQVMGDERA
ncbi:MAG: hypothetical protein ACXQS5_06735 [Candidatus Methanospirareceae archaeon]